MIDSRTHDDLPSYWVGPRNTYRHVSDAIAAGVRPRIDHDALARYLLDWSSWGELFANASALWGGDIECGDGWRRTVRRYPESASPEWLAEPPAILARDLRDRVLAAAEWAVGGARKVGVLVGGIDSSGVLAALAQVVPADRILAMSITGDVACGDTDPDIPYVEELCRHLGVRLLTDHWTPQSSPIEDALLMDSRPAYGPYMTAQRPWLEKLMDAGAEALLAATAGDLVFGGEVRELGYRIPRAPVASIRAVCGSYPWKSDLGERARWVAAPILRHRWKRPPRYPRFFGERLRRAVRPARHFFPSRSPRDRIRDWYDSPWLVTAHLYNHALTHGFSIPYRDVTLHTDLVRFAASVPAETLNCDGRFRGLYHRAIDPWVTRRVAARRSKSFTDPFAKMTPSTKSALREYARGTELERAGHVDGAMLLAEFDRGNAGEIWKFLTAEAWLRAFG